MENQQERQSLALPKNIRQIGNFGDTYKIYVEDFVYTYVHQFLHEKKEENTILAAVLLGEVKREDNREYVFISGAQKCSFQPLSEEKEDGGDRRQDFWDKVYQGIKGYFTDREILGWYINLDGSSLEISPQMQQFFEATYSRGSRFLYYEDSLERIDAFFVQEQHALQRISGYAVYYEKNPQMQEFMISEKERIHPKPVKPAVPDEKEDVAANYRAIMNKLNEKPRRKKIQPAIYVAGVAVLVVVTATGIAQMGNYQNLKVLENTMQTLSGAVNGVNPAAPASGTGQKDGGQETDSGSAQPGTGSAEDASQSSAASGTAKEPSGGAGTSGDVKESSGTAASGDAKEPSGDAASESTKKPSAGTAASGEAKEPSAGTAAGDAKEPSAGAAASGDAKEPSAGTAASGNSKEPSGDAASSGDAAKTASGADAVKDKAGNTAAEKNSGKSETAGSGEQKKTSEDAGKKTDSAQTSAQTGAKPEYYTVKKGDSLVSISRKFYQTMEKVEEICELNGIEDMDVIYEGQKLRLP